MPTSSLNDPLKENSKIKPLIFELPSQMETENVLKQVQKTRPSPPLDERAKDRTMQDRLPNSDWEILRANFDPGRQPG